MCIIYIGSGLEAVSNFETNVTGVAYNVLIKVFYIETKDIVAVVSAQCDKRHKQYGQHGTAGEIGQGVIHSVGSPWYRC